MSYINLRNLCGSGGGCGCGSRNLCNCNLQGCRCGLGYGRACRCGSEDSLGRGLTIALTSDRKYILPGSSVYNRFYTKMYKYPSEDSTYLDDKIENHYPERIKTFNIHGNDLVNSYSQQGNSKCSSC